MTFFWGGGRGGGGGGGGEGGLTIIAHLCIGKAKLGTCESAHALTGKK